MNLEQEFSFSSWRVWPQLNRLEGKDGFRSLEPKVMEVLCSLARQAPQVVPKRQLLTEVWGETFVTEEVLTNAIWELRKALGDNARRPSFIETIRGRGYRLLYPVQESRGPRGSQTPSTVEAREPGSRRDEGRTGTFPKWIAPAAGFCAGLALLWLLSPGIEPPPSSTAKSSASKSSALTFSLAVPSEGPEIPSAHALYNRGHRLLETGGSKKRKQALRHFIEAVSRDPDFAPAFAGLASAYPLEPNGRAPRAARAAAQRALSLDEKLPDAHLSWARVLGPFEWNWSGAELALEKALELDPTSARIHASRASLFSRLGRHGKAVEEAGTALTLAPTSRRYQHLRLRTLYLARRYGPAAQESRLLLQANPEANAVRLLLALSHLQQGNLEAAAEHLAGLEARSRDYGEIGYAQAKLGHREQALQNLDQLLRSKKPSPYQAALIQTGLGNLDSALDWLERAFDERDPNVTRMAVDPALDALTQDSRFKNLCRRLGLLP